MMKWMGLLVRTMQILMVAVVAGLEYFSGKRGGVNHHILARKHQWSQGLLCMERLQQLDILLGVTVLMLMAALVRTRLRSSPDSVSNRTMTANLLLALCFSMLTIFSYHVPWFQQMRASSYATLVFTAATLLQLMLIIAVKAAHSTKK